MGIDKVAAGRFYMDDGDKTKQNWFLYEYANDMFAAIEASPKLAAYRKRHGRDEIAAFCVYFSKRMRLSISNVQSGRTPELKVDARYVYEFYPGNSYTQTQRLLEAAFEAWGEHLQACAVCPNRCLTEGLELTPMFDNLEKTGWPTA